MNEKLLALYCNFVSFLKREDGASAIEYAIIAALIGVAIAGSAELVGDQINTLFGQIITALGGTVE